MSVSRVTITGADNDVNVEQLVELSAEFPFVEWGILISPTKSGTPRYPSTWWLEEFGEHCSGMNTSLHLCGRAMQAAINGDYTLAFDSDRVQINGYVPYTLRAYDAIKLRATVILQARSHEALDECIEDAQYLGNSEPAQVLYDPSGGRGLLTDSWPLVPTGALVGYAGGIGPDNIVEVLHQAIRFGASWVDMESSVRHKDRFDLGSVRRVLERAAAVLEEQ